MDSRPPSCGGQVLHNLPQDHASAASHEDPSVTALPAVRFGRIQRANAMGGEPPSRPAAAAAADYSTSTIPAVQRQEIFPVGPYASAYAVVHGSPRSTDIGLHEDNDARARSPVADR